MDKQNKTRMGIYARSPKYLMRDHGLTVPCPHGIIGFDLVNPHKKQGLATACMVNSIPSLSAMLFNPRYLAVITLFFLSLMVAAAPVSTYYLLHQLQLTLFSGRGGQYRLATGK